MNETDSLEQIIKQGIAGEINRRDVEEFCNANGVAIDRFYNDIALEIARRFNEGTLAYEDADWAMNAVSAMMVEDAVRFGDGFSFAQPAFAIYLAFDEGEYDHGGSTDPVETFTRPQIRDLLIKGK